jgi:hypothetical protein
VRPPLRLTRRQGGNNTVATWLSLCCRAENVRAVRGVWPLFVASAGPSLAPERRSAAGFGPREPRTPTRLSVRELLCACRGVVMIRGRMEGGFRSLRPPRGSRAGLESDGIPRGGVSARPCRLPAPDADEPFGRLAIGRSGRPRSSSGSCASCRRQRFGGMHEHVPILAYRGVGASLYLFLRQRSKRRTKRTKASPAAAAV